MTFTLTGPSNPWWLTYAVGFGIAAVILSWRVWWFVAKAVFVVYYIAAVRLMGDTGFRNSRIAKDATAVR